MILRKPYAFLIKHFKLLHMILTIFMLYLLYKTYNIFSFFGDYVSYGNSVLTSDIVSILYNSLVSWAGIIIIVTSIVLLVVMIVKQKPYALYITNIIIYLVTIAIIIYSKSVCNKLYDMLVDIRIIKACRDLITLVLMVQVYPFIKSFVRAVGFDIKQFDFGKDLSELEIEDKDNEEFEVNIAVDTNKIKRFINNFFRNFKYFYFENKFMIKLFISFFVVIILALTTFGIIKSNKKMEFGTSVDVNGFNVKILNAYTTRLDYKGNILSLLDDDMSLVVIPLTIRNNNKLEKEFLTGDIELNIDGHKFRHIKEYRDAIFDLGITYTGENIDGKSSVDRNLVFEIPTEFLNKKITLRFATSTSVKGSKIIINYSNFNLVPNNLDILNEPINIVDNYTFNNVVLNDCSISLTGSIISDRFKSEYKYCVSNNNCVDSYEYVSAPLKTNKDRTLLKISSSIKIDSNNRVNNIYDLINKFGVIKYKINDKEKSATNFTLVNPTVKNDTETYIAVPGEIKDASEIHLVLRLRNEQYIYKIK